MVFYSNYNGIIKNHLIARTNTFNISTLKFPPRLDLSTVFNTFRGEKSLKLIKLYLILLYISNQKPFLKKIKFNYVKKKNP